MAVANPRSYPTLVRTLNAEHSWFSLFLWEVLLVAQTTRVRLSVEGAETPEAYRFYKPLRAAGGSVTGGDGGCGHVRTLPTARLPGTSIPGHQRTAGRGLTELCVV